MNVQQIQHIRNLFEECARVQGVLVTQPEHILSFRLMVIDRVLSSGAPLDPASLELQRVQAWLNSISRDILDESDELLHVRYQLIYTVGEQEPLDGHPDRWIITQNMLDLVRLNARQLQIHEEYSGEIERLQRLASHSCEGDFGQVRVLGTGASQELIQQIADDALNGKVDSLTFVGLNKNSALRTAIFRFITQLKVDKETSDIVMGAYKQSALWNGILLLRGLLAHGILTFVLGQQRWRVDYGLDLKRSLLAVPYRAKVCIFSNLRTRSFGHL